MTMRKWCLFLGTYFALCLLAACAGTGPAPAGEEPDSVTTALVEYPTLSCRIVDGAEEGSLLLADRNGSGVYRVTVTEDTPVTLDGEPASAADLEDGMPIAIAYDGTILETYPAQLGEVYEISAYSLGTEQNPGGGYYDLCGLYLQVLEDLWEADSGLNSGVEVIGLDLSGAPGDLTESEIQAIAWRFGELRGVPVVTGTYEDFVADGSITGTPLEGTDAEFMEWEDGVLFSITANEDHADETYSLPVLFFNADKWRTSLGAYSFYDCSCLWPEFGTWTEYTVGAEMIS